MSQSARSILTATEFYTLTHDPVTLPELDPQIAAVLRASAEAGIPPIEMMPPIEGRAKFAAVVKQQFGPVDEMFSVEDRAVDGVPVRIYRPRPPAAPTPALVYFHTGGWVIGSIETHDGVARALARRSGCTVVSVEYRLAPEHPYPAAIDDAWTAASWVRANAEGLGLDVERIGVCGESAGGTLAAIVARRGRDAGTPFAVQLLIYPIIAPPSGSESYRLFSRGYSMTQAALEWYWSLYLEGRDGRDDPDASPAAAATLAGLPRAIVITSEVDPLRDEGEEYARRLAEAGVPVELIRYSGMIHGFLRMAGIVERAQRAFDEIGGLLASELALATAGPVTSSA